jgi:glycerol-3-phosphate acyltransferase PlsY
MEDASWWLYPAVMLIAYLIGSVSFAILLSRLFGLPDPRQVGSKNPGATNVLRSGKKVVALLTLIGDLLKGWVVVFAVQAWSVTAGLEAMVALAGLAVFLGHLYPIYFGFEGGKGVATALGVALGLSGWVGLTAVAAWLLVLCLSRYVSLASIVAAIAAGIAMVVIGAPQPDQVIFGVMMLLLIWRHRTNISRLIAGQESRLFSK